MSLALMRTSCAAPEKPLSALMRVSMGDHGQVKMAPGDTVILSSRIASVNCSHGLWPYRIHLYELSCEQIFYASSETFP